MKKNDAFKMSVTVCKSVLVGKICFTSRRKELATNTFVNPGAGVAFGTLHSIADKILRISHTNDYIDIWKIVELLLENEGLLPVEEKERYNFIYKFYSCLRLVENGAPVQQFEDYVTQEFFSKLVEVYAAIKGTKKDWEDSFVSATYALKNGMNYMIDAENIVLLNIEYLFQSGNTNALDFFITLFQHQTVRGRKCYFMNKDFQLYMYSDKEDIFIPVVETNGLDMVAFQVN